MLLICVTQGFVFTIWTSVLFILVDFVYVKHVYNR